MRTHVFRKATPRVMLALAFASSVTALAGFLLVPAALVPDSNAGTAREPLGLVSDVLDGTRTYLHPLHNFSLRYPSELSVEEYDEGGGAETILFYEAHPGAGQKFGFQIFIVPFEGDALTPERILADVPGTVIAEPLRVIINPSAQAGERVAGLVFWSVDREGFRTRELWFVHNLFLYEVTTYDYLDDWLVPIADTWRFL